MSDSEEYGGEVLQFRYTDAVHDEEIRIIARPYEGEEFDEANWIVDTEKRESEDEEWERVLRKWATEKPEVGA